MDESDEVGKGPETGGKSVFVGYVVMYLGEKDNDH